MTNNLVKCRGRLAQLGESSPTNPAIRVRIQAKPPLRQWQKNVQPRFFKNLIQNTKNWSRKDGEFQLSIWAKGNVACNWLYGT